MVEHQEPGVDAVAHAVQRQVYRVGMATKVLVGLKQHHLGIGGQGVGGGQAGNPRAHHRHAGPCAAHAESRPPAAGKKSAVQRPETNKGGREEEETGLRVSARKSGRLHGAKIV